MRGFLHRWLTRGVLGSRGGPARLLGATLGAVAADTVVVTFSRPIDSPGADYGLGVTIEKDTVGQTISTAALQGDGRTVHYVLAEDAAAGDALTFAYDAGTGDLATAASGDALASIAATGVTNTLVPPLGGALVFSDPVNSGHLVSMGV